ncbi:DNA cytosine methyltransferase [Rhodoferax sp. BAB1]|uniref:DNA cytosine methyltransferase n=1 Tax=Rhodoferax sp. BAB1 TaxID=2741720 RepID=UPI0015774307|nr:DNA (cytosine-5-)-methyltransferase [Rhodoferax sp. BAB1]QKO21977.1 DNA (cytosine-5-)-methyltransferase [Rhodoferax sp. BAB1]
MTQQLKAGALFAGIGGFCLGFESVGIKTAWAIENDSAAVATYQRNLHDVRMISSDGAPADIRQVSVVGSGLEPVDILHAGFPCQSFSAAGERRGFDDPRGQLFYEIIRLLKEFGDNRPSVLVLENSPHIRVGEGGSWFVELAREIKKAGYWFREANCFEMDPYALTALPQKRNRLFMVAFSTKAFKNGNIDLMLSRSTEPKRLEDYIDFEGKVEDASYYLDEENRYHKMISNKLEDPYCIYQLRKFLVRVKEPGVCPTLTANMGLGGHNVPFIFDKKGLRKLTERECLNLQGYPQLFQFPDEVPRAKRYMQVGNSVVPLISRLLANAVKEKIEKERI